MIEEIKRIFDDIRDGIIEMGGNIDMCTSPEEYAEAIKGLSGNNAVLFIPCFKASETKPETPVKTMSPANPIDYPDGGGTPDGLTGKIWMTYTVVSVSTTYVPGTEPVLLGAAGESPTPPVYEPQVTRTFVICMELPEAEITPNIPTGGKWDVNNNVLLGTIEYPSEQYTIESILSNGNTAGWSCNNNHVSGGYTWMSVGTFLAENGSQVGSGSDPMCINSARDGVDGHDGRNGVDGTDIEFIYMLLTRAEDPASIPAPPSDPDRDDDVPITGHVPDGTDQPSSIDHDNYPVEIMCQRKKNVETGKGGPFVGPAVGSSWGEDGMDGDGVEYIFRVATNAEVTQDADGKYHLNDIGTGPPTCGDDCANAFYTVAAGHGYTREQLTDMYQHDDFVPGSDISHPRPTIEAIGGDRNGTDDPRDVDINNPFEFVSIRKYDGSTGTWGGFSTPVLWNKYYVTSAPIFTSFAFCRSTKNLGNMTLSGGTVLNPLPSDQTVDGELIHWYNGIPGAAEYGAESTRAKAPIWMTSSKFGSVDPTVVIAPNWSSPTLMADSKYFNVEYSASDTFTTPLPKFDAYLPGVVSGKDYPFIDNTDPEGVNEKTWRSYCISHGHGTGGDTVTNPKGMATCTFEGGHGTDGTVTQIEGEIGADGPGVEYVYIRTNTDVAPTVRSKNSSIPIVDTNGHTYVDDEFLPLASGGALQNDTQCTDDPTGVDATYQYEGIAKRVKVFASGSTTTRVWEEYTGPMSLWAKGGEQGAPGANGQNGTDGRGIVSVVYSYMGSNDGTNHPSASDPGWSASIPANPNNYTYLWRKTVTTYSSGTTTETTYEIISKTGQRGRIGPKMRMRDGSTSYTAPDAEGVNGGQCGDNADDVFYDIAKYNDTLYRCTANLLYQDVQFGDTPATLTSYFTQAQSGDFVATSLLLANKISADQIDVDGLSAKAIVTETTNDSFANITGNTIELKRGGSTKCKISGEPITVNASNGVETVGSSPLGCQFTGGTFNQGFTKTINLGAFTIDEDSQHQTDLLFSDYTQQINLDFVGRGKQNVGPFTSGNVGVYVSARLIAKNQATEATTTWAGYGQQVYLFTSPQETDPGNLYYSGDNKAGGNFELDTTESVPFDIGTYDLSLTIEVADIYLSTYFEDMTLYLSQYQINSSTGIGRHSAIVRHEAASSEVEYTDIGIDGIAHVLDGNNKFVIQKESNNNYLTLTFLSGGTHGLKIDGTGIYKTTNGGTTGVPL